MSSLKTLVIILTKKFRIEGDIELSSDARLTDFMNISHNLWWLPTLLSVITMEKK